MLAARLGKLSDRGIVPVDALQREQVGIVRLARIGGRGTPALEGLVAALAGLDYPRPLLDIKLLVEEDDDVTIGALCRLDPPDWIEVVHVPRGLPRTKPRRASLAFIPL